MTAGGNSAIVQLREVTKVYRQGAVDVRALRGLTFDVAKGEFTAICGPSGSGKTTALNLIGALDSPTSGTVMLEGADLSQLNRRELSDLRRDRIGFVFQAYNLIPVLTAYENAETVMWVQRIDFEERRKREFAATWPDVDTVEFSHLATVSPSRLQGGRLGLDCGRRPLHWTVRGLLDQAAKYAP